MNPRKPTQEEKEELIEYTALQKYDHPTGAETSEAKEEAEGWLQGAAIAVFDHYVTDSPGYAGRVLVVVWPGGPELTQTFIWNREEKLELCPNKA